MSDMNDIAGAVRIAMTQNVLWSINEFYSVIEKMKYGGYSVSFWENEDNWASIIRENEVIGYVWKKYPLSFVVNKYLKDVQDLLGEYGFVVFIEVKSLVDKMFKISSDSLENVFQGEGLNRECFSAEDLWFYTNNE